MNSNDQSRIFTWLLIAAVLLIPAWGARGVGAEFDRASYQSVTLDELVEAAPTITKGLDIFLKKHQFTIKLEESPKKCQADIVDTVLKMLGVEKPPATSHCVMISTPRGRKLSAYVQDSLVAHLRSSVKPGQDFHAYVLYFYVDSSKKLGLLVSAFDEMKAGKDENATGGT